MNAHPERLRAVYVNGCNPLRSYPDTTAYEKAFAELDLLVVSDIVMSETARFAHYVLPCRNAYESWDGTFFSWTYPGVYFQMRQPLVEPPGDCREAAQIFTAMADRLGIVPDIPEEVRQAARGNRLLFGAELWNGPRGSRPSGPRCPSSWRKPWARSGTAPTRPPCGAC